MTIFTGETQTGDRRGRTLGFPTINIRVSSLTKQLELQKNSGVFIVTLTYQNQTVFGLLHLGPRPTFQNTEFRIEIYVLETLTKSATDFLKNIPEKSKIQFRLIKKIREVQKFRSQSDLISQIKKDVKMAEVWYQTEYTPNTP